MLETSKITLRNNYKRHTKNLTFFKFLFLICFFATLVTEILK